MTQEFVTVLNSLKVFGATVEGVKKSYGIDDFPEKFSSPDAQIPALIMVPEMGRDQGYATATFMGNAPKLQVEVAHLLFYKLSANSQSSKVLPGLLAMVDAYNAAAKASPFLTYNLSPAYVLVMQYAVSFEQGNFANVPYHVIRFQHKMSMNL